MSLSALDTTKTDTMEFWGREVLHTNNTRIGLPFQTKLKAIGINQCNGGVLRNKNSGMVEIPNNTASFMHRRDGTRNVLRHPYQKPIVRFWKMDFA
ncbi:hypothetical protein D3C86_1611300 [compost metagenome]